MSVTLDLPPNILEQARKYAASEGVSLNELLLRMLKNELPREQPHKGNDILGRMRGTVVFMAEDFNAPLEDLKEYME